MKNTLIEKCYKYSISQGYALNKTYEMLVQQMLKRLKLLTTFGKQKKYSKVLSYITPRVGSGPR